MPLKTYRAFLFDMDGTILSSIAAAERIWGDWAAHHGIEVAPFLARIHGQRAIDTVRNTGLPGLDIEAEAARITQAEIDDTAGIVPIAGAGAFLASLPPQAWAIVTSAPLELARARLKVVDFALPPVIVTSEDVTKGKPAPDCYLLAAQKLGVDIADCLVFEDAPAGITAGEAAGADVVVITETHTHPMATPHRSVRDYSHLVAEQDADGGLSLVERA